MILWSYLRVGKTIECSLFELIHRLCRKAFAVGGAGVDLGLLGRLPAEDRHQLVGRRAVLGGAGRSRFAKPVG